MQGLSGLSGLSGLGTSGAPSGGSAPDLTTGLTHYYRLTGASGADAIGAEALSASGSVSSAAGILSTAAHMDAEDAYLHSALGTAFALAATGTSYILDGWFKLAAYDTHYTAVAAIADGACSTPMILYVAPDGTTQFYGNAGSDGNSTFTVDGTPLGAVPLNAWNYLLGTYDAPNQALRLSLNGSAFVSLPWTDGLWPLSPVALYLGTETCDVHPELVTVDEVGFWSGRTADAAFVAARYNGGAGAAP